MAKFYRIFKIKFFRICISNYRKFKKEIDKYKVDFFI